MRKIKELLLYRFVTQSDPKAFSEIVNRHAGMVYGVCLRILQDEDKAADAAQETFFQLLRSAESIKGSVAGWLHRAATCRAIDHIRSDTARRQREQKYSEEKPRCVEQWEQISPWIDEELNRLDEQTREILTRYYFESQTTREIGKEIGISQATVSRRIEAGLDMLRTRLSKRGLMVATASLGGLLGQNAAQAAPAALVTELGKMALVAGTTTGLATSGAGTAAVSAGEAAAGGILVGAKVKIVTAAAVVAIGTGSVITYNHYVNSPDRVKTVTAELRTNRPAKKTTDASDSPRTSRSGSNITSIESTSKVVPVPDTENRDDFDEWFDSLFFEEAPPAEPALRPVGGNVMRAEMGMGGGMMMGGIGSEGEMDGGMMGGMGGGMGAGMPSENDVPEEEIQQSAARRIQVRAAPSPESTDTPEEGQP